MYLELVNSYRTTRKYGEDIKPRPPVSEAQIAEAEARLGTRFPKELRAMLHEMDGDCDFLLSLEEIIEYNEAMASESFAGAKPLFVATDGAGGLYGYVTKDGGAESSKLVFWDHETGEISDCEGVAADSLYELIKQFYDVSFGEFLDGVKP